MKAKTGFGYTIKHLETKVFFAVVKGAPSEWASERGATYTLLSQRGGTRPAKVMATIIMVGVDEDENGNIVWEKWPVQITGEWESADDAKAIVQQYRYDWKHSGFKHLEALADAKWEPVEVA